MDFAEQEIVSRRKIAEADTDEEKRAWSVNLRVFCYSADIDHAKAPYSAMISLNKSVRLVSMTRAKNMPASAPHANGRRRRASNREGI